MSERTDGMTGKRQAAHAAGSGHRAAAAGRPALSIERVRRRLDMETGRFLFDDGSTLPRWPLSGKTQRYRWVEGVAASGRDAGSHMRQIDRGAGSH